MNNKVDDEIRLRFRDWLRKSLQKLDFYQKRGDHYLIREFAKYCVEQGVTIDEASLGRYLRDENYVLPTPTRCVSLARALGLPDWEVKYIAGYISPDNLAAIRNSEHTPSLS